MGDDNAGEVTPLSVSAYFDETHKKYLSLVRGEEETGSQSVQTKITEIIGKLEDLTRQVSVLGIISENENYKEMNPTELKFILLPFMMGNLWQLSRADSRENVCHFSKVYFRDYLKRCFNYEIINKLPPGEEEEEEEEKEDGSGDGVKRQAVATARPPPKINSDDLRAMKVQRFKEAKALDEMISPYLHSHLNGEALDDEDLRTFVVALLKRNALEAEDQLRSIAQELELIKFAEKMKLNGAGASDNNPSSSSSSSTPHSHSHSHHPHSSHSKNAPKKKPHIFILTKSEVEKQVYGAGYPAIPVMTVEELYEQRIKSGQWGGHSSSSANLPPVGETDDDRDAQNEQLEEQDDDELLARQRQMDDYKDDHRRGWGNRYNRS